MLKYTLFAVIAEIEKDLPIAAFNMEWRDFKGSGKTRISLTHLEMILPIWIAVLCTAYIVFRATMIVLSYL